MEIELILGHIPVGKSSVQSKKIQDATCVYEAGAINPLAYGLASFSSKPLESNQSELQSGPLNFEEQNASYRVPPYPMTSDPKLFLPDVPNHSVSENTTLGMASVPVAGSDAKSGPLPRTSKPELYPPQKQSLPCPPIQVSEFSPCPKDTFHLSEDKNLPYPSKNISPYPIEEFNTNKLTNSSQYHKHKFGKKHLHYFNKSSCPGPVEKSEISRPYSDSNNLPYPKEKEKTYSAESPYSLKTTKTTESYSITTNPLYSKEVKGSKVTGPPYPMNSEIRQYPSEITPRLHKTDLPYPKEDSSLEGYVSKKSEPYLVSNNPPYPKDDSRSTKTSISSVLVRGKVGEEELSLLRDSVRDKFHDRYPPYPKESLPSEMPMLPSSFRASFEDKLPYPSRGREETEWPLLPPSAQHLLERAPELPTEMPMPLHSVSSTEVTGSSYSNIQSNLPYPVANKSTVGRTAPYPTEKPNPYSTLGFAEFAPMPTPTKGPLIFYDFIGFTVPTSTPLKDAKPLPPLKTKMDSDFQPSAPLLSDIKTPPIAYVEEVNNFIKKLIDDSHKNKESISNVHEDISDVSGDIADVRKDTSDVRKDIPDVSEDIPDINEDIPDVRKDIPDVVEDIPDVSEDVPQLPTPPASEIETVEGQDKSESSSFEKASNSSKKKQDRLKRKKAVALEG